MEKIKNLLHRKKIFTRNLDSMEYENVDLGLWMLDKDVDKWRI
jgi:hypothetical protein